MIKFIVHKPDGVLLGFGLSAKNIELLKEGHPIRFDGSIVGLSGFEFLFFVGTNEPEMLDQVQEMMGRLTKRESSEGG